MIVGLGNDIQVLKEIERLMEVQDSFVPRILTPKEQEQLSTKKGKNIVQYVAGRYSVKEAYAKATGYGIGEHAHWQEIEILSDDNGRPILNVTGDSRIEGADNYLVAISHSDEYVSTIVIVEKNND